MRTIVIPIADMHTLSKIGMMPDRWIEDEGTPYQRVHTPNDFQKNVLLKNWDKFKKHVFGLKADEIVLFLMGDLIHGNNHGHQVISTRLREQADAAIELLLPFANRAAKTYCVAGTKWHVGPDGTIEDRIAKELGAYKKFAFDKLEVKIQGIRFMLQHKGPSLGSRTWLLGNGVRHTIKDASIKALQEGRRCSDVYLWAHFHTLHHEPVEVKEPEGMRTIHAFTLPAWVGADEYAMANVKNLEYSSIGGIYFDIVDGQWSWHAMVINHDNVERVRHG